MVLQGLRLGFVSQTGIFVTTIDALTTIFLAFCALLPSFFFFSPYLPRHISFLKDFKSLCLCISHLLLSSGKVHYPASSRIPSIFFCLIFFVLLISRVSFLLSGALALDLPIYSVRTLFPSRLLVFLCLTAVCDHLIYLHLSRRKEQQGHWMGVLLI